MFLIHVTLKFHNLVYFVGLPPQVFNKRGAESSKLYSLAVLYWLCIPDLVVSKSPPKYSWIETMFLIHVKMNFHNLVYFVRLPPQVFNERATESSKLYSLAVLYWLSIPDLDDSKSPPKYSWIESMFLIHVKLKFHNMVYFVRPPPQVFNERAAESSKLYSLATLCFLLNVPYFYVLQQY